MKDTFGRIKTETVYMETLQKNYHSHRLLIRTGFAGSERNKNMDVCVYHSMGPDMPLIST